jgi:hypothetical protein
MKYILPMLLMITAVIYAKAQVTSHNPVINVSVIYSGKQPGKVISDSTAILRVKATDTRPDSTKVTDGRLSSDKLVKDILSSLHETKYSESQKVRL